MGSRNKGDNLTSISKKFGLSIDELKKMNGMSDDKIQAGKKVIVGSVTTTVDIEDKEKLKDDIKDYKRYINSGEYMLDQQIRKEKKVE